MVLPLAIAPAQTIQPNAKQYSLITIGFKGGLNYPFVVNNTLSSAQIIQYLPLVLEFPFGWSSDPNILVRQLVPFNSPNVNYTITVAEVYFPINSITMLQSYITNPESALYNNSDSTQEALAELIDPLIQITGLILTATSVPTQTVMPENGSMGIQLNSAEPGTHQTSKVAGVAVGSVVGCSMYISFMFFLIRRLKMRNMSKKSILPANDFVSPADGDSVDGSSNSMTRAEEFDFSANYAQFMGHSPQLDSFHDSTPSTSTPDNSNMHNSPSLPSARNSVARNTSMRHFAPRQLVLANTQRTGGEGRTEAGDVSKVIPKISDPFYASNSLGW
ncbi:hypothetical protein BABINDRAFT_149365 [Babjeviella inositovora NRRL Y-12698]|uniref:Uncharacterized protein n=1 Tax=Babjeviella inositovora NRRL Y-12698 TaxID=984486 RepID=A0A1E3QQ32_9ASCO|nr:uncharacterized protein BABINDRAFT_149365 [Babjeviella inositovora NRRL Y-12698]ODQ79182.1 hypothetical protein BABINDRAFT_149365 [Babjeviella inositovora NRRL Y-12698]